MDWFWGIVAIIGSVGGIGTLIYLQARGGLDRVEEDGARAYFDEHQRWPDESAEDAQRRGHQAVTSSLAGVIVEDAPPPPPRWWQKVLRKLRLQRDPARPR